MLHALCYMSEDRHVLEHRIKFLMTALQLSPDIQESWLNSLARLTEADLKEVAGNLEREYYAAVTKSVDDELAQDLALIQRHSL